MYCVIMIKSYHFILLKGSLQFKNVYLDQQTTVFSVCQLSRGTHIVSTRYVHQQREAGLSQGEGLKKAGFHYATNRQTTTTTTATTVTSLS